MSRPKEGRVKFKLAAGRRPARVPAAPRQIGHMHAPWGRVGAAAFPGAPPAMAREKCLARRGDIRIGEERNRSFEGVAFLFVPARFVVSVYRDASAASHLERVL
jgi:hypothetical protein